MIGNIFVFTEFPCNGGGELGIVDNEFEAPYTLLELALENVLVVIVGGCIPVNLWYNGEGETDFPDGVVLGYVVVYGCCSPVLDMKDPAPGGGELFFGAAPFGVALCSSAGP